MHGFGDTTIKVDGGTQDEVFARTRESLIAVYREEVAAIRMSVRLSYEQEQHGTVPYTSGNEREHIISIIYSQKAFETVCQGGITDDTWKAFGAYLTSFREDWDDSLGTEPPYDMSDWLFHHMEAHNDWTR